ncbi:MAG: hypothetical protein RIT35_1294 [Pseudomonadota bacterium]
MFNNSTFCEILKLIPRDQIKEIVRKSKSDKNVKNFSTWDQLIAMLYDQLAGVSSLRDVVTGFNMNSNQHYHLHSAELKRSTFSDANNKRDCGVFKNIAEMMIMLLQNKKKGLKEVVSLLDSSPMKV